MFKKLLLTSAMLVTFTSAYAQQKADFGTTGTVTPSACAVTLTGGIVNLGSLTSTTVKSYPKAGTNAYVVPLKTMTLAVVCNASTKFAMAFVENKVPKPIAVDQYDFIRYSITDGASGTTAIGAYQVLFRTSTADYGTSTASDVAPVGQFLSSANGTQNWVVNFGTAPVVNSDVAAPGRSITIAKTAASLIPSSLMRLDATVEIAAFLSINAVDSATTTLTPNGSGTLTLVYL